MGQQQRQGAYQHRFCSSIRGLACVPTVAIDLGHASLHVCKRVRAAPMVPGQEGMARPQGFAALAPPTGHAWACDGAQPTCNCPSYFGLPPAAGTLRCRPVRASDSEACECSTALCTPGGWRQIGGAGSGQRTAFRPEVGMMLPAIPITVAPRSIDVLTHDRSCLGCRGVGVHFGAAEEDGA